MVIGSQSQSQQPRVQGGDSPWTGHPSIAGPLTDTHWHSLKLGQCRHANSPKGHVFSWGRKPKFPEKFHTIMGEGCANSTETVAIARNQFFLLINIRTESCWTKNYYLRICCMWDSCQGRTGEKRQHGEPIKQMAQGYLIVSIFLNPPFSSECGPWTTSSANLLEM